MKKALCFVVALMVICQSMPVFARDDDKATLSMPSAKGRHWYVVVCSSRASRVSLQAGRDNDENSVFATWRQRDGQKRFYLPRSLQARTKVYVRMSIPEGKWKTEACVGHDGYAKQAFSFNSNNENHDVSMDDNDNGCACR